MIVAAVVAGLVLVALILAMHYATRDKVVHTLNANDDRAIKTARNFANPGPVQPAPAPPVQSPEPRREENHGQERSAEVHELNAERRARRD